LRRLPASWLHSCLASITECWGSSCVLLQILSWELQQSGQQSSNCKGCLEELSFGATAGYSVSSHRCSPGFLLTTSCCGLSLCSRSLALQWTGWACKKSTLGGFVWVQNLGLQVAS
jgi:hypothetical protein